MSIPSEILRRFPGLRILDGVSLERVIFPIERKPKVKHTEEEKAALIAKPFSFPVEVRPEFFSEEAARNFAMAFCAKYVMPQKQSAEYPLTRTKTTQKK